MTEDQVEQVEQETAVEATETAPAQTAMPESVGRESKRKVRVGVVVASASDKTVTVKVERRIAHPLYGKGVSRTKKHHAHDENNEYRTGDKVRIIETRPLSKTKRWRVVELLERPE